MSSFEEVSAHLKKLASSTPSEGVRAYYICTAALVWAIGQLVKE